MLFPVGFEQEPFCQRFGLWGFADPDKFENEPGSDGIPLSIDEGEVDLGPQSGQVIGVTAGDGRKVDERKLLGAVEWVRIHCGYFAKDEFPNFLGDV